MQPITDQEEEKLIGAVKRAMSLVADGLTPNDAIEKVARDDGLLPGYIRSVCYAHNNGQQLNQFEDNRNILDKLATFPLADADEVIGRIYKSAATETRKAASVVEPLDGPPLRRADAIPSAREEALAYQFPKAAEALPERPKAADMFSVERLYNKRDELTKAAEEARIVTGMAREALFKQADELVDWLQGSELPYGAARMAVTRRFGEPVGRLLDGLTQKQANAANSVLTTPLSPDSRLFEHCGGMLKAAAIVTEAEDLHRRADAALDRYITTIFQPRVKAASFLGGAAVGGATNAIANRIFEPPKTQQQLIEKEMNALETPEQLDELRRIRTMAWLNSVMTDPDDPLAGQDPEKVLSIFNEAARMAPNAAEQPMIMRPTLRRGVQGDLAGFEAKELADVEKLLVQSRNQARPTNATPGLPN